LFIGHYAVALAAKSAAPRTSLGTLFAAAQLVDLIWPIFLLLGIEHVRIAPGITAFTPLDFYDYPWTHSLLMVCVWGVLFGGGYYALRRAARPAVVVGLLVVSHWVLDLIVHRPDLPLVPGGTTRLGLGLWSSVTGTVIVESLLFVAGLAIYVRFTRPVNKVGMLAFWSLIAFLIVIDILNLTSPPPPSTKALAWGAIARWLLPFWAGWADGRRTIHEL